jgi:tetratricopeptide (TPR) repeat protein
MKRLLTGLLTLVLTLTLAAQKKSDKSTSMNLQWGIEALRNGEIEEGMALLEKVIADDPTNGYAYLWLALGRSTSDDVDAILTDVNNALKYLPKKDKKYKGTAYSVRAKVYLAQKDTVAALNDYTLAIKCAPDFQSLYEDRAQLYFELHQYELSNNDYDKLLELDPNSGLGFMGKGRNYRDLRRYDLAIKHFTYVLQTHPNYSKAYSFRAECLLMQNNYSEAADDILLALDIDEDDKARMLLIDEFNGDKMNVMKKKLERMKSKEPNRVLWCYY